MNPKSLINGIKLFAEGHTETLPSSDSGSHWQMGGVLVVNPDGKVVYRFISVALDDFPPESDIETIANAGEAETRTTEESA